MNASPTETIKSARTDWFMDTRFGMFIHFGLYAIPARGEWVQSFEKIDKEQYRQFFEEFNPTEYDPRKWARAAKDAGMKYVVLTAKHHDGFCLFDSQYTDYKSTNTKYGKDLIKHYVEALREEGLRVGLYYSLIDWHHDDYPAFGDRYHPMRENEEYKRDPQTFDNYVTYMHNQIRELLTNYGKIDIMWYDFSYDDLSGERWKATDLVEMIRSLQPDMIIDNRLEASGAHSGSIMSQSPEIFAGDFASPEQIIPNNGLVDTAGNAIPWEACITLNNNWGYHADDQIYKSAKTVIRKLVECVSKNGNMMINVGPDATGRIPLESLNILSEVGEWLRKNGDSIYGCGKAQAAKQDWGRYTQKGNKLYAHLFEENIGPINLAGLSGKIKKVRLLTDGSELELVRPWNTLEYPDDAFINFGTPEWFTFPIPDDKDTVVELELFE